MDIVDNKMLTSYEYHYMMIQFCINTTYTTSTSLVSAFSLSSCLIFRTI